MPNTTIDRRTFLAAASFFPAAVRLGHAQPPDLEPGFVSLFDGRTLAGWSVRAGPASAFKLVDGDIVVDPGANFPTWLCSDKQYENFDFRCEFFLKGWMNSGIYLHAPEHGRNTWVGMKINLFHQADKEPKPESAGSIFPLVAPRAVNVRNQGEWNSARVLMDWPRLQVWMNDTLVQDLDVETIPDLKYRLRRGYLGFESLSYPIRFRNIRVRELPSKETWETLYGGPEDFAKWQPASGTPLFEARGAILHGDGNGQRRFRPIVISSCTSTSAACSITTAASSSDRRRRRVVAGPQLRDSAPRRRRGSLRHRLALFDQALDLPADRAGEVVPPAARGPGCEVPGPHQWRERARVRGLAEPRARTDRAAGPRRRPLDRVHRHQDPSSVIAQSSIRGL